MNQLLEMAGLPDPNGRGALAAFQTNSGSVRSPRLNKRLTAKRALTQRRTPTRSFAICVRHDKQTLLRPRQELRRFDDMDSWSMRATFPGC